MLARLAKLAQVGRALDKRAGVLGRLVSAPLKAGGKLALKHPGMTAAAGLTGASAAIGSKGKYNEFKTGFDPAVQKQMLGLPPIP